MDFCSASKNGPGSNTCPSSSTCTKFVLLIHLRAHFDVLFFVLVKSYHCHDTTLNGGKSMRNEMRKVSGFLVAASLVCTWFFVCFWERVFVFASDVCV